MTTQERLRAAAKSVTHLHIITHGAWLHELLDRAADEMDAQTVIIADLAIVSTKANVDPPPESRVHNAPKA